MRIIPLVLCTILVVTTAAPNPGSYSSARHYQFQRSSSSYRNNELQHKDEEAGAYGRIEDPEKYDKPLEQSHYRQTSYNAPGTDDDSSNEDEYPSQTFGIKGGRPNSFPGHGYGYGHSANYHRGSGYFGQGVIDSDYTTGDSFYQPGRGFPHEHGFHHPPGFNHPPGNHYGHHQHRGYHHGHGYHHQHQETSSQSSSASVTTTQNKNDDQLISLDQTFDYSKFKDQGFGKEYLENTEGQRVTTPKPVVSTTENVRPIFEITEAIPEQPGFSSQMGNDGRSIQQNQNRDQQGQSSTNVFGQNSQQGQTFQQGQNIDLSIFGQNSQQGQTTTGQVFREDQSTTGQFGSASQLGKNEDTQQQVDFGQIFLEGQTNNGQNSQEGIVLNEDQTTTGQFGSASQLGKDQDTQQQVDIGQIFQQGQVLNEDQTTTGQFGSASQLAKDQDTQQQVDIGQSFQQGSQTAGQDHLKPFFEQIDKIASMDSRDHTNINHGYGTNFASSHHNYGSGRNYNSGHHREIVHHTTGYIKPKYETDFTHHQHAGIDEPDCEHKIDETQQTNIDLGKMEFQSHHKEDKVEEMTTQENIQEVTTVASQQEVTTKASQQEVNNMEMTNQERQEVMSQGNLETMTEKENQETTTADYYHQKHEEDYNIEEDLTQQIHHYDQQTHGMDWNGDIQQHQDVYGKFDYDGQHQEDLTQQTQDDFGKINSQEDLTQQHQNGWTALGEDLTQKQEKNDEEYGHLEFGGQQQEDLSQKNEDLSQRNEDFGSNGYRNSYGENVYRNSYGYSTASSRSYSSSSSSRTSSSYGGASYNIHHQTADQTADLTQNKEQFATEVQDVSQQVQKVESLNLEEQKETPLEPEEIAVVVEEKTTAKPGFWKRLGGSISRTYENAKEKVKNNLG